MDQIVGAVIFLLIVIAQIIKAIRESAESKQANVAEKVLNKPHNVTPPKPKKPLKQNPQRLTERPLQNKRSVFNDGKSDVSRQKALVKRLPPQGEGRRFNADPGTLDTEQIVTSTISPHVKPKLESMTGIYDQGATLDTQPSVWPLNLTDCLSNPQGLTQAVILAEVLNRPDWSEQGKYARF